MQNKNISEWIAWIKTLTIKEIDLGLERVAIMAKRLNLLTPVCPVITIAGTNGKGSTVAGLEAIYIAAGFKVGAFTSPYLYHFNEQIRVDGIPIANETLIEAFEAIISHLDTTTLTPFEFTTLAALYVFKQVKTDVMLLEVGLGGRLDAVNVLAADLAIITSIDIDHVEYLGATRELIALEKVAICRPGHRLIYGDLSPPLTLLEFIKQQKIEAYYRGQDFSYQTHAASWDWLSKTTNWRNLPLPSLALANMTNVLMALELMQARLPVSLSAIKLGLTKIKLAGRLEVIKNKCLEIYDVAHNPAAISWLATFIKQQTYSGKVLVVFSMLKDKDIAGSITVIKSLIDDWYIAPLNTPRTATLSYLQSVCEKQQLKKVNYFSTIKAAYRAAKAVATEEDMIIIFGSFHTIAEVRHDAQDSP